MGKLILTADDYGLSESVNAATIQSVKNRTVTSVQVMANLATEEQIRELAAAIHESGNVCGIGLHFCTTAGPSLLQKETSFTEEKDGKYYFIDVRRWNYTESALEDMRDELTAQFSWMESLLGSAQKIDSFSSHQNIHMFNPEYMKILDMLGRDALIPVRSPVRWSQDVGNHSYPDGLVLHPIEQHALDTRSDCEHQSTKKMLTRGAFKAKMRENRLIVNIGRTLPGTPDSMCGHWYGQPSKRVMNWTVQQLDEKTNQHYATELLMHLSNSPLENDLTQNYTMEDRMNEFTVLNSNGVRGLIESLYERPDFELGSYRKVLLNQNVTYNL